MKLQSLHKHLRRDIYDPALDSVVVLMTGGLQLTGRSDSYTNLLGMHSRMLDSDLPLRDGLEESLHETHYS